MVIEKTMHGMIACHGAVVSSCCQGRPPFNNMLARKAVYLALDRKGLANVWAQGNPVSTNYDVIPAQEGDIGFIYNPKAVGGVHPVEFGMIALWGELYTLS